MKKDNYLFKSERLGFRNWKNGDLDEFIKLNSDDKVMEHFPKSLSKNETGKLFDKLKNHFTVYGFTYYATEILKTKELLRKHLPHYSLLFYMYKSDFLKILTLVERL